MFELLPELQCPDNVLQNIDEAVLDQEKHRVPDRKLKTFFESFRWRLAFFGAAAVVIILIVSEFRISERYRNTPAQYSQEEAIKARTTAKWSLAYATKTMSTAERDAVHEILLNYFPKTIRQGIHSRTKLFPGG